MENNMLEKNLCLSLVYYLFAVVEKEKHNLDMILELLNFNLQELRQKMNSIPEEHITRIHFDKLNNIDKEEYKNISNTLKLKIENQKQKEQIFNLSVIASHEEVDMYAEMIINPEKFDYYNKLYNEKNEKYLCMTVVYYIIATREDEEQNPQEMLKILNYSKKDFSNALTKFTAEHPAKKYFYEISSLNDEQYKYIAQLLSEKIIIFSKKDSIFKITEITCEDDVEIFADVIVESDAYETIDEYIEAKRNQ